MDFAKIGMILKIATQFAMRKFIKKKLKPLVIGHANKLPALRNVNLQIYP